MHSLFLAVTIPIQLSAVNSLITLCPYDNSTSVVVKEVLLSWLQQNKLSKSMPEEILAPYIVAISKFQSKQFVQFCEPTYWLPHTLSNNNDCLLHVMCMYVCIHPTIYLQLTLYFISSMIWMLLLFTISYAYQINYN